ncbi:MAG: hypothetical protein OEM42_04350 [Deltaproteobacteria bacterium]|nr:hypothetical protein [Deltaproteobacteria bacterium]
MKTWTTLMLLFAAGCSGLAYHAEKDPDRLLARYDIGAPNTYKNFTTCSRPGCSETSIIRFSRREWQQVVDLFTPPSGNAAEERRAIARAVGLMERLVGPKNDTFADEARNTLKLGYRSHQLACISESLNTTVFLQLFQRQQLLRWHRVRYPAHRGVLDLTKPHNTAVVEQNDNGALYAVDSWFRANGEDAVVVPLAKWRDGYDPGRTR